MSTLTKVLIILQTVFSILLCGIVATYVANASDYKQKYDMSVGAKNAAVATKTGIEEDWNAAKVKLADAQKKAEETTVMIFRFDGDTSSPEKEAWTSPEKKTTFWIWCRSMWRRISCRCS